MKKIHLPFAVLLQHRPTKHDFGNEINVNQIKSNEKMCGTEIEPIANWSDPGQLSFVSYPVYVSSVPDTMLSVARRRSG